MDPARQQRRRTRPSPRGEARRDAVLAAAGKAFAERGFRGASLARIAADVGVSQPGLLHHFPNKKDLLLRVIEQHSENSKERDRRILAEGGDLQAVHTQLARAHEADPTFLRLFIVLAAEASVDPGHPARDWFIARYRDVRSDFVALIEADQRNGRINPELDPATTANLITAILDGIEMQFLLDPEAVSIVDHVAAFYDLLAPRPADAGEDEPIAR